MPAKWNDIAVEDLVLATLGSPDGWFECIVTIDHGEDLFTLRYRDFPDWDPFVRRREHLALVHPGFTQLRTDGGVIVMSGEPRTDTIRDLNDAFRQNLAGRRVYLTAGVLALPGDGQARLIEEVRRFTAFDAGNDPHGEHGTARSPSAPGATSPRSTTTMPTLHSGSPDPAAPTVTRRVT